MKVRSWLKVLVAGSLLALAQVTSVQGPVVDPTWGEWWVGPVRMQGAFQDRAAAIAAMLDAVYADPSLRNIVPRGDETLEVEADKDGKLNLTWTGRTDFMSGAYVALLDKGKKELLRHRFEKPPIAYSGNPPEGTAYYRLVLTFVNGSATTITAPVPEGLKTVKPKPEETKPGETTKKNDSGLGGP